MASNNYINFNEFANAVELLELFRNPSCEHFYRAFAIFETKGYTPGDPVSERRLNSCISSLIKLDTEATTQINRGFMLKHPVTMAQKLDAVNDIRIGVYKELYHCTFSNDDADAAPNAQ